MLGFCFMSLSAVLTFPLFLIINAFDWLSVLSTLNLNLFNPCSWEAPSTRHLASRKAPKCTQTLRKSPPLTPQLLVPQRCLTRWKNVEKTSHRPSKLQPQCEYMYTWMKMVAQRCKSQFRCPGWQALLNTPNHLQDHGVYRGGRTGGNCSLRAAHGTLAERERADRYTTGGFRLCTSAGAASRCHEQHAGLVSHLYSAEDLIRRQKFKCK